MAGSTFVFTDRDRRIGEEARRFGVVTRDQLMRLGLFTSATRAKARLKILTDHGVLTARPHAVSETAVRFVYLPGPQLVDRGSRRRFAQASPFFVDHQLGLVDIRIAFERATLVERWLSEKDLTQTVPGITPDAYVEYAVGTARYAAFVEYDRGTETLSRIAHKVRAYTQFAFSGAFEQRFKRRYFRLLLVTNTPGRLVTLSKTAAGVTEKVVRLCLLRDLIERGPLQPIWRRPGGEPIETLIAS